MTFPVFPALLQIALPVEQESEVQGTSLQSKSGRSTWLPDWPWPLYHYTITINLLRSTAAALEWQTLKGFWNIIKTSPGGYFYYDDPDDDQVTEQLIGTGDGVTTVFQPVRTLGGFTEPVSGAYVDSNPPTNTIDYGSVAISPGATVDYGSVASAPSAFIDYSSTPIADTHFYVSGVEVSAVIDPTTGMVEFDAAPANGQPITWTGPFYKLCEFDDPTLDINKFAHQYFELNKLKFSTARL